jgi:hypothetical protein
MYRTCIFCSSDLGKNEALEHFPIGARLAFDAWQGRLWALCGKCGRWNLAPIEERWEAVEEAEKQFRSSRLRVHSENIGLAKLPDGTGLIRVGESLPDELAAWRYGDMLRHRRYRHWLAIGGGAAMVGLYLSGIHFAAAAGVGAMGSWIPQIATQAVMHRRAKRPLARVPAELSPTAAEILVRRADLNGARLQEGEEGAVAVLLPHVVPDRRMPHVARSLVLTGELARSVMGRAMVDANARGASSRRVTAAVEMLASSGGSEAYLENAALAGRSLGLMPVDTVFSRGSIARFMSPLRFAMPPGSFSWRAEREVRGQWTRDYLQTNAPWKSNTPLLALEMALHEESERRALQGELAGLEAAWREAEEIAQIADSLLDDDAGAPQTDTPLHP